MDYRQFDNKHGTFLYHRNRFFQLPENASDIDRDALDVYLRSLPLPNSNLDDRRKKLIVLDFDRAEIVSGLVSFLVPKTPARCAIVIVVAWVFSFALHMFASQAAVEKSALEVLWLSPLPHEVIPAILRNFGLLAIILTWHELGHLAVLRRYNIGPAQMGLTSFIVFPAMYTRAPLISAADDGERAAFFAGGVLFQGYASVAFALLKMKWPEYFEDLFYLNIMIATINAIPMIKLDGHRIGQIWLQNRRWSLALFHVMSLGFTCLFVPFAVSQVIGKIEFVLRSPFLLTWEAMTLLSLYILILASFVYMVIVTLRGWYDKICVLLLQRRSIHSRVRGGSID